MVVRIADDELNQVLRALADTTRRDILRRTVQGKISVSELAEEYAMSFAAVQKHVAVLERAGLVGKDSIGRERLVTANPAQIARARAALERLEELWRHRLEALDSILLEPKE
ncbi:MAG TPA: metalloregulator ArsR/SmtB family transcription factor [Polyangiaceae bacterium]|nr:metalloregulator ArsR/SmtB family transcription factor [Polyangiaceae bacterium]